MFTVLSNIKSGSGLIPPLKNNGFTHPSATGWPEELMYEKGEQASIFQNRRGSYDWKNKCADASFYLQLKAQDSSAVTPFTSMLYQLNWDKRC